MNNWNSKRIKIIQPARGPISAQGQTLVRWWPTGVARPKGRDGPWPTTARRRAWQVHGDAADDGWQVLVAGLGRQRKLEEASRRAPDMVSGGGAHPSGMPVVRGRSSGWRLRMSTPDVEGVAGSDPGEVLRLGRGYAVVRHKPIWKRRRGCRAHRGGKQWRCFGANSARATVLWRSRPMHGLS
jgi:hypothetical protein